MTRVETTTERRNPPRDQLLKELTIAFARADVARISELVAKEIRWMPAGGKPVEGREAFGRAITRYGPATKLTIEHVVSDEKVGAVDGIVEFGQKRRAFCFVFEFSDIGGTKVSGITSYSTPLA